jgi:hypothetical protein
VILTGRLSFAVPAAALGQGAAVGNVETLALYGGPSALFFFLVLYLQQVAGYSPLKAGLAVLPESLVMFALSSRFGALADRLGPRFVHGRRPVDRRRGECSCCSASESGSTTWPRYSPESSSSRWAYPSPSRR